MQTLAVVGKPPPEVDPLGHVRRRTAILLRALTRALSKIGGCMDFDPRSIDDSRDRDDRGRELIASSHPAKKFGSRVDARHVVAANQQTLTITFDIGAIPIFPPDEHGLLWDPRERPPNRPAQRRVARGVRSPDGP